MDNKRSPVCPTGFPVISNCFVRHFPRFPCFPIDKSFCMCKIGHDACREWLTERAGILEFDGGYERKEAERMALGLFESITRECSNRMLLGRSKYPDL